MIKIYKENLLNGLLLFVHGDHALWVNPSNVPTCFTGWWPVGNETKACTFLGEVEDLVDAKYYLQMMELMDE